MLDLANYTPGETIEVVAFANTNIPTPSGSLLINGTQTETGEYVALPQNTPPAIYIANDAGAWTVGVLFSKLPPNTPMIVTRGDDIGKVFVTNYGGNNPQIISSIPHTETINITAEGQSGSFTPSDKTSNNVLLINITGQFLLFTLTINSSQFIGNLEIIVLNGSINSVKIIFPNRTTVRTFATNFRYNYAVTTVNVYNDYNLNPRYVTAMSSGQNVDITTGGIVDGINTAGGAGAVGMYVLQNQTIDTENGIYLSLGTSAPLELVVLFSALPPASSVYVISGSVNRTRIYNIWVGTDYNNYWKLIDFNIPIVDNTTELNALPVPDKTFAFVTGLGNYVKLNGAWTLINPILPALPLNPALYLNGNGAWTSPSTPPTVNQKVIFMSTMGNDSNDGLTFTSAKLTLAASATLAGNSGNQIIIAPGTYPENTTITNQNLSIVGNNSEERGLINFTGTIIVNNNTSSIGITGVKFNVLTKLNAGSLYLENCGTQTFNDNSFGYLEMQDCDTQGASSTGTLSFTGNGTKLIGTDCKTGLITVNSAGAVVVCSRNINIFSPTLISGTLAIGDSVVYATSGTTTAINATGGTLQLDGVTCLTPTNTPARLICSPTAYQLLRANYDYANSTIGGTNAGGTLSYNSINSSIDRMANNSTVITATTYTLKYYEELSVYNITANCNVTLPTVGGLGKLRLYKFVNLPTSTGNVIVNGLTVPPSYTGMVEDDGTAYRNLLPIPSSSSNTLSLTANSNFKAGDRVKLNANGTSVDSIVTKDSLTNKISGQGTPTLLISDASYATTAPLDINTYQVTGNVQIVISSKVGAKPYIKLQSVDENGLITVGANFSSTIITVSSIVYGVTYLSVGGNDYLHLTWSNGGATVINNLLVQINLATLTITGEVALSTSSNSANSAVYTCSTALLSIVSNTVTLTNYLTESTTILSFSCNVQVITVNTTTLSLSTSTNTKTSITTLGASMDTGTAGQRGKSIGAIFVSTNKHSVSFAIIGGRIDTYTINYTGVTPSSGGSVLAGSVGVIPIQIGGISITSSGSLVVIIFSAFSASSINTYNNVNSSTLYFSIINQSTTGTPTAIVSGLASANTIPLSAGIPVFGYSLSNITNTSICRMPQTTAGFDDFIVMYSDNAAANTYCNIYYSTLRVNTTSPAFTGFIEYLKPIKTNVYTNNSTVDFESNSYIAPVNFGSTSVKGFTAIYMDGSNGNNIYGRVLSFGNLTIDSASCLGMVQSDVTSGSLATIVPMGYSLTLPDTLVNANSTYYLDGLGNLTTGLTAYRIGMTTTSSGGLVNFNLDKTIDLNLADFKKYQPTLSLSVIGGGLGSGASVSLIEGNMLQGRIYVAVGTAPSNNSPLFTITFPFELLNTPIISIVTPDQTNASPLARYNGYVGLDRKTLIIFSYGGAYTSGARFILTYNIIPQ